jgi:FtsP/CotA-like multicopper oxidase with cupredoxin domain
MKRRDFLKYGGLAAVGSSSVARLAAQMPMPPAVAPSVPAQALPKADFTLQIAPLALELAPNLVISTTGYNSSSPGPLLRLREGVPVTVDVVNDTDIPEFVHWHGLLVPADVDGAEEEGTPVVPPRGRRRYQFTPRPAGTRWYHTHAMAGMDLHRGTYTGQYGFLMVDPANNPGNYDQEVFLALRDWEPFFSAMAENEAMEDDDGPGAARPPQPERPTVLDTRPNGLEVTSQIYSINDKSLGSGEPIRVRPGSRVLMHFLNASAIENRRISLPGHQFNVVALDGNPVPTPRAVEVLAIGPGERIDAFVEMNQPGIWILGEPQDMVRNAGLGVVVEYANQPAREPRWVPPADKPWDYTIFGRTPLAVPPPERTIDMVFEKVPRGEGQFNSFLVNGKPYPHEREFLLQEGARYLLVFHNRTNDAHPLHLHRHLFELVDINGIPASGIVKDTVVVPYYGRASVELLADQPGLSLFHCHIQHHMDFGFKALFFYE